MKLLKVTRWIHHWSILPLLLLVVLEPLSIFGEEEEVEGDSEHAFKFLSSGDDGAIFPDQPIFPSYSDQTSGFCYKGLIMTYTAENYGDTDVLVLGLLLKSEREWDWTCHEDQDAVDFLSTVRSIRYLGNMDFSIPSIQIYPRRLFVGPAALNVSDARDTAFSNPHVFPQQGVTFGSLSISGTGYRFFMSKDTDFKNASSIFCIDTHIYETPGIGSDRRISIQDVAITDYSQFGIELPVKIRAVLWKTEGYPDEMSEAEQLKLVCLFFSGDYFPPSITTTTTMKTSVGSEGSTTMTGIVDTETTMGQSEVTGQSETTTIGQSEATSQSEATTIGQSEATSQSETTTMGQSEATSQSETTMGQSEATGQSETTTMGQSEATSQSETTMGQSEATSQSETTTGQSEATSQSETTTMGHSETTMGQSVATGLSETTSEPTTTGQSETTSEPTTTGQSETTSEPTTTGQSETTSEPATTGQSETTSEPTTTGQSETTEAADSTESDQSTQSTEESETSEMPETTKWIPPETTKITVTTSQSETTNQVDDTTPRSTASPNQNFLKNPLIHLPMYFIICKNLLT